MKSFLEFWRRCGCLIFLTGGLGLTWSVPSAWSASAESADQAWAAIKAMEGGPVGRPQNRREAQAGVSQHLQAHLKLLEDFIARYPQDPRRFEAELQRSALLASLGKLLNDGALLRQGRQLAEALEKSANLTETQAADAGFQRVSLLFLEAQASPDRSRDTLLNATQNFVARYPHDRRGARLLAEVATIFDAAPTTKRTLLESALRSARELDLVARIRDDLRQMDLIGQRVPLEFPTLRHGEFSLSAERGKVVVVLFWAADSPHSLWWLRENLPALQEFPSSSVAVVTISLDRDRSLLEATLAEAGIGFPTAWDGLGWESPLARTYGINRLPTVWIFDRTGRLRVGNGTANPAGLVRRFLKENLP